MSMSLLGFGMETMLANFHMCHITSNFQHARDECDSRRPMCLGVIFTLFHCLFDMTCDECNVITVYCMCCSVNGSV